MLNQRSTFRYVAQLMSEENLELGVALGVLRKEILLDGSTVYFENTGDPRSYRELLAERIANRTTDFLALQMHKRFMKSDEGYPDLYRAAIRRRNRRNLGIPRSS